MDATALFISETDVKPSKLTFKKKNWDRTESVLERVKKKWGNADDGGNQPAVVHHAP